MGEITMQHDYLIIGLTYNLRTRALCIIPPPPHSHLRHCECHLGNGAKALGHNLYLEGEILNIFSEMAKIVSRDIQNVTYRVRGKWEGERNYMYL